MRRIPLSLHRRFSLWLMEPPHAQPHVSASLSVQADAMLAYLDTLNQSAEENAPRVSIMHLISATVGRLYREFPQANRRLLGRQIFEPKGVGIAMPVNLLGHASGQSRELGIAVIEDADRLSLCELARRSSDLVRQARGGSAEPPWVQTLAALFAKSPDWLAFRMLDLASAVFAEPLLAPYLERWMKATAVISNVGAALSPMPGVLMRGAAPNLSTRLAFVGSMWGLLNLQDEVVPVDGRPEVCRMLPVVFLFDHRLIDGVLAGKILARFTAILRNPAAEFGPSGERTGLSP